ncbi:MBL fold metallo-hydrolase [Rhodococcus triatomae]|uniref:Glyoxylase, beta-lactamase superfamily II n=1 Tax=Rhodococcus triatomae TaxID=300028 RepID=A0A1G8GE29_9NOCA|nr:MBL fold metallo-hydrolase [Rhodococcus triatomae]QNG20407.1 MBL fold metallo-hydrolase [Rhodococcus triatomae]QNG23677.1 MBL fold metallo-hydrolase [Rhodococcus triatomae]SDH92629.1 Glyoxylase, beta-lactamase superfamily II [Rhodococcus triatomae]
MIEITGHRQREAWRDKVLPPVEQVRPGIWSIPVPMPGNPLRYVLVYALALPDGLALIDAGWDSEESWAALTAGIRATGHDVREVRYTAITHLHPDHFGLVPRLRAASGTAVAMHRSDAALLRHHDEPRAHEQQAVAAAQLHQLGAPGRVAESGMVELVRFAEGDGADILLDDGAGLHLPGWSLRAAWTPGHTPGHLCFVDDDAGLVFSGDHVLPRISPNISTIPGQLPDPLGKYLRSLDATVDFPEGEVLPSHEYRFRGLAARARDLRAHHEARLDEIRAATAAYPESTAWEITTQISWSRPFDEMTENLGRLAVRETQAHLVVLEDRGLVHRAGTRPERWHAVPARIADIATASYSSSVR